MKLPEALFRETWLAYQILEESYFDEEDNFHNWELHPLRGPTLAEEDVEGPFEGRFIVAAKIVSGKAAPPPCYLEVVLPERISERHFLNVDGRIVRGKGRRTEGGTIIPSIGIERRGVYTLFHAKQNPMAGIDVLRGGIPMARQKGFLEWDLAYLLRDQKMYREAIDAFSECLGEFKQEESNLAVFAYKERSRLYAAIGERRSAEADEKLSALAARKGHK
jgi:hypothetical protein